MELILNSRSLVRRLKEGGTFSKAMFIQKATVFGMKISSFISKINHVYKLNTKHKCPCHLLQIDQSARRFHRLLQMRSSSSSATKVHFHNEKIKKKAKYSNIQYCLQWSKVSLCYVSLCNNCHTVLRVTLCNNLCLTLYYLSHFVILFCHTL